MNSRSPERKYRLFLQLAFLRCKERQKKGDHPYVLSHELNKNFPYWFSYMQWAMSDRLFHADGTDKYYPDESVENLTVSEFNDKLIHQNYE